MNEGLVSNDAGGWNGDDGRETRLRWVLGRKEDGGVSGEVCDGREERLRSSHYMNPLAWHFMGTAEAV